MLTVEITLKECLQDLWQDWFKGMTLDHPSPLVTRLKGQVVDQAALYGLLERIRDLNLKLISVQISENPMKSEGEE